MSVVEYMYTNNTFNNIPLGAILSNLGSDAEVFSRFLDENILLRRDIGTTAIFGNTEVVNFTYDEFRDFLIANFLLEIVYVRSLDEFKRFVEKHTTEESISAEGLRSFLFLLAKKHPDRKLHTYISSLDWYDRVFLSLIWNMQEKWIDEVDINRIKGLFNPKYAKMITDNLVYLGRWDKTSFQKLNIHLLFEILNGLDDDGLNNCLYRQYAYNNERYYYEYSKEEPPIDKFIDELEKLNDDDFSGNPEIHHLYQFLLYFLPVSKNARYLYGTYLDRVDSAEQAQNLHSVCNSERLKCHITSILQSHEVYV